MVIRTAHIGTGNVGRLALSALITDPRFELTAVAVSSEAKIGRDAGDLAGIGASTGISATGDIGAVLVTRPDCVVYCAIADNRMGHAMKDLTRIDSAGINIVGSAPVRLQYPWGVLPDKYFGTLESIARQAGASIFITGIDPGFANDLIPLTFAATCQTVNRMRCIEIADYATYDGATVLFDVMGFGTPPDVIPPQLQPGTLAMAWGPAIRQLAAGLGVEIDEIAEHYEREPAPEAFDIAAGHIPAGGQAALRFEIRGLSAGREAIVIEHVTRLREGLRPDWPQPAQPGGSYRVEITGEPSYTVDVCPTSRRGRGQSRRTHCSTEELRMGRVDGKVALISGGSRGMGASHARLLAAEGASVVIGDILDVEGQELARS